MFEVSAILKTLRKSFSTRSAGLALLLVSATLLSAQELPPEILVETSLIVEDGAEGDSFGAALAVDGNAMVVAAPGADLDGTGTSGAVFVYTRNTAADPWTPTHNLVPDEGHFDANFLDMATAIEGDTIAVGAPYATLGGFSQEGAVYVFERNQGGADNWGQVAKLTTTASDSGAHFGGSLAIEGDLLVAGASEDGSSRNGRVTLFERDRGGANGWGEVTTLEHGVVEDAGHPGAFGSSLAIEGDLLLIGARDTAVSYLYESDGAAYLFRRNEADPDHWDFLSRLITPGADQCVGGRTLSVFWTESSPEERVEAKRCAREDISTSGDHFGTAVALSGDMIAIGANSAEGENGGDMSVGAVHLFQQDPVDPNQWNHLRKLTGSNASALAYFGGKLDLVTDTLIVGADGAAIGSSYAQGAAYVFERNAGGPEAWEEIEKLLAGDGVSNAYFGTAVVLDGLTRLVGAKGDSGARGAVYLHEAVPVDDPDDPPIPAYPATGEVTNDSILEDPSGVILGAVESAALDTLPVWIHEIPAPEEPMFDGAIPVGDYYNVGAVVTTPMPSDTPFAVALPVPDEVDPDRLTLAALVSSDDVLDDVSAGMFWIPVTGTYDVENGLYVVVMAALSIEGSTIVLIEHPELATAQPRSAPALRSSVGNSGNFEVNCYIPDCEETMQRTLDQLELAYAEYQKSFPFGPNLMKGKWELCGVKFCSMHVVDVFTGINLFREARTNAQSPCTGGDALTYAALYTALFSTINFCIEAKNHTPEHFDATVSHELFHAYQLSLGPVFDQYNLFKYQEWILEATATAAAGSLTPAVSPPGSRIARDWTHPRHDIRRIDFSFTAPPDIVNNYEAQDFWVHQGQYRNRDLGFLRDMIEQGVTAENIDNQFQLLFGSSLGDEYWRWVKNQLMLEDDIDFSFESNVGPMPAPLGEPPCQIQPKVVKHDETTMSLMLDHTLSVDQAIAHTTTLALLPLQSNVVEITFNAGTTSPVKISVTGLGHKHKVYLDQPTDVDNAACRDVKNGDREINGPLPPGAKAYVLVSNTLVPTNNFWPEKKSTYEVHVDFEG